MALATASPPPRLSLGQVGKLAGVAGRDAIMAWLERPGSLDDFRGDPPGAMARLFAHAHLAIRAAFRLSLEQADWLVHEEEGDGYLVRRRHASQPWSCIHGGTSCSVLVLLDGVRLFTGNVGDSSALLGLSAETPRGSGGSGGGGGEGAREAVGLGSGWMVRLEDCGSAHLHAVSVLGREGAVCSVGGGGGVGCGVGDVGGGSYVGERAFLAQASAANAAAAQPAVEEGAAAAGAAALVARRAELVAQVMIFYRPLFQPFFFLRSFI